jgi:hypothetical protein
MNKGKGIIIVGDLNVDYLGNRVNLQLQSMLNSYGLQAIVDVPMRIQHKSQTAKDEIILNKDVWVYTLKVKDTGFSDHKAQILQVQFQYKSKKWKARLKGEYRIARSYKEDNVQYLNYLLGKETWKRVFKQNSGNEAYNLFLYALRYYYDIAMPKKCVQIK